jgi:hypothetical protein
VVAKAKIGAAVGLIGGSVLTGPFSGMSPAYAQASAEAVTPADVAPDPDLGSAGEAEAAATSCLVYAGFESAGSGRYRAGALGGCNNTTYKIVTSARLMQCRGGCSFTTGPMGQQIYLGGGTVSVVRENTKTCFGGGTWNVGFGVYGCDVAAPPDGVAGLSQPCDTFWWAEASSSGYYSSGAEKYKGGSSSGTVRHYNC